MIELIGNNLLCVIIIPVHDFELTYEICFIRIFIIEQ